MNIKISNVVTYGDIHGKVLVPGALVACQTLDALGGIVARSGEAVNGGGAANSFEAGDVGDGGSPGSWADVGGGVGGEAGSSGSPGLIIGAGLTGTGSGAYASSGAGAGSASGEVSSGGGDKGGVES